MSSAVRIIAQDAEGNIFMQFRDGRKRNGSEYTFCFFGGGVDEGEEPLQAACREFVEETGISILPDQLSFIVETNIPNGYPLFIYKLKQPITWQQIVPGLEGAGVACIPYADFDSIPLAASLKWFYQQYPQLP